MHPADASKSTIEMSDEAMGYNLCILTSTHHFGKGSRKKIVSLPKLMQVKREIYYWERIFKTISN